MENFRVFKGNWQVDLSNSSSNIPVTLGILRSAIFIEYAKNVENEGRVILKKHIIRYPDIESVLSIPNGLMIITKVLFFGNAILVWN